MKKRFAIAGPVDPLRHYFLPHRLDIKEFTSFIENMFYFVLHAPRQSGKTTGVNEIAKYVNQEDTYNAVYINIESAQAARDNVEKALISIIETLKNAIQDTLQDNEETIAYLDDIVNQRVPTTLNVLRLALSFWAKHSKKPVVLFIDEIDSLIGDSLLSVLRQIRSGYMDRPNAFPQSICLIGLRDVRDYRVWSKESGEYVSTSSPFNIKAESFTISNFSKDEVKALYGQHTEATGQKFTDDAIDHTYELTKGQPWLVNALAYQCCFRDTPEGESTMITKDHIEKAKNQLILRRDTHLDSLVDKLSEERVIPIIDAIISGEGFVGNFKPDDVQYVRDLGLVAPRSFLIANPIYQEIIPRELTWVAQDTIQREGVFYKNPDGSLNFTALMKAFTQFFRENSEAWLQDVRFKESAPHLLLMAYLQRIINGGGVIQREYALGRKRVDLLILWKNQKIVAEIKIRHSESTLAKGLEQTVKYMDRTGANEGHLIIVDRDSTKSWEEKISTEEVMVNSHKITVWTL